MIVHRGSVIASAARADHAEVGSADGLLDQDPPDLQGLLVRVAVERGLEVEDVGPGGVHRQVGPRCCRARRAVLRRAAPDERWRLQAYNRTVVPDFVGPPAVG